MHVPVQVSELVHKILTISGVCLAFCMMGEF